MKFLGLAHPRCGTHYTASLFHVLGYKVRHEGIGDDGTVSWMWAVKEDKVPFGSGYVEGDYRVFHIVRNPVFAIPTIANVEDHIKGSLEFRKKYIDYDDKATPFQNAAVSFLMWNEIIESWSPEATFRVESLNTQLPLYLGQRVQSDDHISRASRGMHTRTDWETIASQLTSVTCDRISKFCRHYGYSL